ncbi:hypothetical protein LCI01_06180 [Leuconostoc citreum]|nr:hypothetical protein LCI01_06180 [Leuconostoc citreum]
MVIWPSDWLLALLWYFFFRPCDSFLATVPVIVHGDVAHPLAWYRVDALPASQKAILIADELHKRYTPELITIQSRARLAQWFNISVPTLIRLEHMVANYRYHKFCPLKQETSILPKVDNRKFN